MKNIKFEWDPNKNKANFQKHKITFEEAQTVFYNENARQYFDEKHSRKKTVLLWLAQATC